MLKASLHHSLKFFIGILFIVAISVVVLFGIIAGFLSQGPIDLSRTIPFIQNQINDQLNDNTVMINRLHLEWQGYDNPLGLSAESITVSNNQGPYLFAPEIDLDISLRSLLLGRVRIQDLWIRNIALSITRTIEGQIEITGGSQTTDNSEAENPDYKAIPNIVTLNELIHNLPAFETFWIDGARIVYRDLVENRTQRFDPVTVFMKMDDGHDDRSLMGYVSLPFGHSDVKEIIKMNFMTQAEPLALNLNADIKNVALDHFFQFIPALPEGTDINMTVNAGIKAQLGNLWSLQKLNLDMNATKGQVTFLNNKVEEAIDVSDVKLSVATNPTNHQMNINAASFTMNEKAKISLSGDLSNIETPEQISGNLTLKVKSLPQAWFKQYWPANATNNGAYRWLVGNMADGTFDEITLSTAFDRTKTQRADGLDLPPWLAFIKADFAYHDMTIDYRTPMAKATKTKGTGTYKNIGLSLNIESADIDGLAISNATLYLDDLVTSGAGNAILKFPIKGDIQSVFNYIEGEPINAFKNVEFNPKSAKGSANLIADIKFPLAKDTPLDEFDITVTGQVNDVNLKNAVRNLTLSGGPYDVRATINDIALKGSGQLAGEDITLDWHEYFSTESAKDYLSKVTAQLTANHTTRKSFMSDFSKYFKGKTGVTVDYTKDKSGKKSLIDLNLDLKQTQLQARSLGLLKPLGQTSSATLNVHLKNGDLASIKNLNVKGRGASLAAGDIYFTTIKGDPLIKKGILKKLLFGENKLSVDLGGDKDLLKINVTGAFLDARPILEGQKDEVSATSSGTSRPFEIGVDVLEMRTSDEATVTEAEIYTRNNRTGQVERFEMNAKAGRGDLYVRYTPDDTGILSLQVESNNAGDTLRAFDLYPNIQGGTLRIAGVPLEGGRFGDVRGQARIDNFKVTDAPVLVRLLNALSFKEGGKLNFKRLESQFEWRIGDDGDIYTIRDGRTAGASIGLTFDGYVDTAKDELKIKGTAAPLTGINNVVGNIPLIGKILTGGGALVAATYSIDGPTKDPKVNVNPLSVLTPGIIRKMLFENSTPEPDNQKPSIVHEPRGLN